MKEKVIGNRIVLVFDSSLRLERSPIRKYAGQLGGYDVYADSNGEIYRCPVETNEGLTRLPQTNNCGTRRVSISSKRYGVAVLVAKAFFGKKAEGRQVIHINGHSEDNRLENLGIDITQRWDGGVGIEVAMKGGSVYGTDEGREEGDDGGSSKNPDGAEGSEEPVQQLRKVQVSVTGGHSGSRKADTGKVRGRTDPKR